MGLKLPAVHQGVMADREGTLTFFDSLANPAASSREALAVAVQTAGKTGRRAG